ncbi:restriction endonuclease subunit S [Phocaeicola vulgatus]|jgi:restriction modification system DNA specificity domain protein|uniref:restriction endonuclease subunit S n=1 Tax=Phocaeicola vulgatus TaxID=821 RepID=UPI001EED4924|nr:restriction endonuclease subunit S [Phocaeicola vulgatus]MCG0325523.1 restriction endonuclease subunit S [Phocaeicola vulgatus]
MKNKDMEKGNEIKIAIPALRFPEFQDTEGWKEYILGDFLLEQPRYGINAPAIPFLEELPTYIRITDISENGCFLPNPKVSVNHGAINDFYLNIGDLVFARTGASVGKCYKYKEKDGKLVFAGFLIKVSPDQTRLSSDFLFQFTFTQQYWKWIDLTSTRSGQPGINSKELASMELYLPVKDEQQKIADCLSSLDDLIEATAQKVRALEKHKKGLMQRLFPAEGKNVPDLRFPEFQGMKGWEKKQIKDFGEVITGNTPSKKEEKYWNGDFVWVTAQDFKGKYINDSILKLTKFGKDKARVIPKDSVLVTCIASIGLNAINKVECSTNQQINAICCNQEYNYEYVYYLVTYNTENLKQLAGQTAVPIITKKSFEEFEVYTIENYDEQQKIADCLSSLDELIETTSRKVEILKEHKKGLMQQLFPKI